eukprot:5088572-Amphidinium_carterae.1
MSPHLGVNLRSCLCEPINDQHRCKKHCDKPGGTRKSMPMHMHHTQDKDLHCTMSQRPSGLRPSQVVRAQSASAIANVGDKTWNDCTHDN